MIATEVKVLLKVAEGVLPVAKCDEWTPVKCDEHCKESSERV